MRLAGAIDIGGTATKIGIVAEDGSIVRRESVPTSLHGEPMAVVDAIVASLRPMLDAANVEKQSVSGVGGATLARLSPRGRLERRDRCRVPVRGGPRVDALVGRHRGNRTRWRCH